MGSDHPIYNIGAVERLTDIPAATLRAWERRYGFPEASRTEGGHRLYSEQDVSALQWVKAKIDQGVQTRQAIEAFQAADKKDGIPTEGETRRRSSVPRRSRRAIGSLPELTDRLIAALIARDLSRADRLLRDGQAFYTPEELILEVILPTFEGIGVGWEKGEIGVSAEHLATQYLRTHLLTWMRTGPPAYAVPPTILACAPGEWHEAGLLIFGALLRRLRWPIIYLGQSVPLADLERFIEEVRPLAVVLTAMRAETAQSLLALPQVFAPTLQAGTTLLAFGGQAFVEHREWREKIPGFYLGDTIPEGIDLLEAQLQRMASSLR
ncbi:MAG: MerR family transcriptional regulator [Anaerolineae bacterium]|jgi:DNA-binding transcriptional MerR regulator|nr:MerR family transcriptional regulator [Anaerolineae bacterium]